MLTTNFVTTEWFRANYYSLWPNNVDTNEVSVKIYTRVPAFSSNLENVFSKVTSLSSLHDYYPEWVESNVSITAKSSASVTTPLYLKRFTASSSEYLQLGSDTPWIPANVDTNGGFYLEPNLPNTSFQEIVSAAVFYLVGTFTGLDGSSVEDPVIFSTTFGIGQYLVASDGSIYGQSIGGLANPDFVHIIELDQQGYGSTVSITHRSRSSQVATLTLGSGHDINVGDTVGVSDTGDSTFDVYSVVSSVTDTTISFPCGGSDVSETSSSGDVEVKSSKFSVNHLLMDTSIPKWEPPYTQHIWFEPQRINFMANPSFENGGNFWRASIMDEEAPICEVESYNNGLNTERPFVGHVFATDSYDVEEPYPLVLESNFFPKMYRWLSISFKISGEGTFNFGIVVNNIDYCEPVYLRSSEITLSGGTGDSGFQEYNALIQVPDDVKEAQFRVEFQASDPEVKEFWIDDVLVDPSEGQYRYFDGNFTDSLTDDYRWMGGQDYENAHFSVWYNNFKNTSSRINGSVDENGVFIPGLTNDWVPNGTTITTHWNAVTSITPYDWQGDAFYRISNFADGLSTVSEPTSTLDFQFQPIV